MSELKKPVAEIAGVSLSANSAIQWKFTTGVVPYSTVLTVHKDGWKELKHQLGQPLTLKITDARDKTTEVQGVTILHEVSSNSPNRVSFFVSDKRWRWRYPCYTKDFNMVRKTGDRTAFGDVPETETLVDEYDYLGYSLDNEIKWTPRRIIEDVLDYIDGDGSRPGSLAAETGTNRIESFPNQAGGASPTSGTAELTVENLEIRDSGDIALSRALQMVPGSAVYIDAKGDTIVFDGTNIEETQEHFDSLEELGFTYNGAKPVKIDRQWIRPGKVFVYYQRELEIVFDFKDHHIGTASAPGSDEPFCENVVPTPDHETEVIGYQKPVPGGTYIKFDLWLAAMQNDPSPNCLQPPWDWDVIKRYWKPGELDAVLGMFGQVDLDETASAASRISALKQHFRQTFRINRKYSERMRRIMPVRAALLDPVTGARAPATVWGQMNITPTKGALMHMNATGPVAGYSMGRNVDILKPHVQNNTPLRTLPGGPQRMSIVDADLGVFRIDWIQSVYGNDAEMIPCLLVGQNDTTPKNLTRHMLFQEEDSIAANALVDSEATGIWLDGKTEMKVMCTFVPNSPNNLNQFHKEEVSIGDIEAQFTSGLNLGDGSGPDLHLFVSPTEQTARYAWENDQEALATLPQVLGLEGDGEGIEEGEEGLAGYVLANQRRSLKSHALSVGAEAMMEFVDAIHGECVTKHPDGDLKLVGTMSSVALRIAPAPSGKVDVLHSFPGKGRLVSRMAFLPESVRHIVLGTVE